MLSTKILKTMGKNREKTTVQNINYTFVTLEGFQIGKMLHCQDKCILSLSP